MYLSSQYPCKGSAGVCILLGGGGILTAQSVQWTWASLSTEFPALKSVKLKLQYSELLVC